MLIGKNDRNAHWAYETPRSGNFGEFLFLLERVAYTLGWLPAIYLRPAICKWTRQQHLPKRRLKMTEIRSLAHTPFLYLSRGGSTSIIAHHHH